jgi:hypothetical protein
MIKMSKRFRASAAVAINQAGVHLLLALKNPLFPAGHQQTPTMPVSMAPTDNSNWAVLRKLARARFPEDKEVVD